MPTGKLPTIHAVFDPQGRTCGDVPVLTRAESVEAFLRERIPYPCFAKPRRDAYGRFGAAVARRDTTTVEVVFMGGNRVAVREWVHHLPTPADLGHLFQELLRPSAPVAAVTGGSGSIVRMMVFRDGGATPIDGIWKIPVAGNWNDNFEYGRSGNLIALVGPESGGVARVVTRTGFVEREVKEHPDTGGRDARSRMTAGPPSA